MELMTMQEQVEQAQHGLQLSPEEYERQVQAIEEAWEDTISEYHGENE
jgi:hypothetical protein